MQPEQPPVIPPTEPTPSAINPQPTPGAVPDTYPGKGMGIAGFVLAFTGTQLIGLILSIIAYKKSKAAGVKNSLAFAGIILNSIILGLAILFVPLIALTTIASYQGITQRANTSLAKSTASEVVKDAEVYYAENGTYPTTISQLNASSDISFSDERLESEPSVASTVAFYECGGLGNAVEYWDASEDRVQALFTEGSTFTNDQCSLVTK